MSSRPDITPQATQLQQEDLEQLGRLYDMPDKEEVAEFLTSQPFLIPLLTRGYEELERVFGGSVDATLRVEWDPEVPGWAQLVAAVRTGREVDDALAALWRFDEQWFLDVIADTQGALLFDVEFV